MFFVEIALVSIDVTADRCIRPQFTPEHRCPSCGDLEAQVVVQDSPRKPGYITFYACIKSMDECQEGGWTN